MLQTEQQMRKLHSISLGSLISDIWISKRAWFWLCLIQRDVKDYIIDSHLCDFEYFQMIIPELSYIEYGDVDEIIKQKEA